MDTLFVALPFVAAPFVGQLEFIVTPARVMFCCMLVMLATFVAGIALGQRRGYARGLKDGNPFPRLRVGSPYWNWLARVFAE